LKIKDIDTKVLNLTSFDFLGLSNSTEIKTIAQAALDKYGCGSCGPRGFYGTIDQHLKIEEAIAKFLGTEVRY
jgi:serine palmitoyltransferase